jgi:hypothetical protein
MTDLAEAPAAVQCRLVNGTVALATREISGTNPGMVVLTYGLVAKTPTTVTAQCAATWDQLKYVGMIYATKVGSINQAS